jgi:hypothetical protein
MIPAEEMTRISPGLLFEFEVGLLADLFLLWDLESKIV